MNSGRKQPVFDLGEANVWCCRQCKAYGPVNFDRHTNAFGMIEEIRSAHRQKSPECEGGTYHRIEIVNFLRVNAKGRVA